MLIHYLKKIVIIGGISGIIGTTVANAGLFGNVDNSKNSSPISSLSDNSDIEEIIKLITSINGELDEYFNQLNLDNIANQIGGDSTLFSCMTQGLDLDNILPKTSFDGICRSLNFDKAGIDLSSIAKCTGMKIPSLSDNGSLSKFCNKDGTSADGSIDSSLKIGGAINKPTKLNPKGATYSATINAVTGSIELGGIPNATAKDKPKKIEERKFPSGKTGDELFKKDGGALSKEAKKYPNGSTANALKEFNKEVLVLKEIALETTGTTDVSSIKLPATKADAINETDNVAQTIASQRAKYEFITNYIVNKVQQKFKDIDANSTNSIEEYYKKEKEAYKNFVENDKTLQILTTLDATALKTMGANLLRLESLRADYINDPSQTRADTIVKEQRAKFKYLSLIQNIRNAQLKTKIAIEISDRNQEIRKVIRQAYSRASLWRGDIAKKEIDTMLSAVDQIIK